MKLWKNFAWRNLAWISSWTVTLHRQTLEETSCLDWIGVVITAIRENSDFDSFEFKIKGLNKMLFIICNPLREGLNQNINKFGGIFHRGFYMRWNMFCLIHENRKKKNFKGNIYGYVLHLNEISWVHGGVTIGEIFVWIYFMCQGIWVNLVQN